MTLLLSVCRAQIDEWYHALRTHAEGRSIICRATEGWSVPHSGQEGQLQELAGVRYALIWGRPPGLLARLPELKIIFSAGAGVDHLLGDADLANRLSHIPVIRIVNANLTGRMVEYVVLHVLAHHRQLLLYRRQQEKQLWAPARQDVAGAFRVGFSGFGEIARAAAVVLQSLGFPVTAFARTGKPESPVPIFCGARGWLEFLGITDILVNLLPLTPATRGLIDGAAFRALARDGPTGGPVFVNCGRGGSVNEADLVKALRDGTLMGASLDVFETEPLPPGHPLWTMDNVMITPHNAADSEPASLAPGIFRQIRRFEAGLGLENLVNREVGY